MDVSENIKGAIECDEVLTVRYHGGSKPGTVRQILPLQILDDGKVRVRCYSTNSSKVFVIDKIEIVDDSVRSKEINWSDVSEKKYLSIEEVYQEHGDDLKSMGWHLVFTNDPPDDVSIKIYDYFKNGKIKKTHSGSLSFEEFESEYCFDTGEIITSSKKRARPYSYHSPDLNNGTFAHLAKCVDKFLIGAQNEAPKSNNKPSNTSTHK
jgi:hypothetical protein